MDYNKFGFKNKVVDKFNNMYGSGMGDGPEDPPKTNDGGNKVTPDNATPEDINKIRKGNINRLMKQVAEMDRKAEENNVTDLPAFLEKRKEITDQIIALRSKLSE